MKKLNLFLGASMLLSMGACHQYPDDFGLGKKYNTLHGKPPIVIGHRGASGLLPEHTIESYTLAIEHGADFIEPDLVLTKDSVLICRHEPMLSGTTNIGDLTQFSNRKRTIMVDGVPYEDWFASDFTLAEIKTLKAIQPMTERPQEFNGLFSIPTLQEVIDLARTQSHKRGKTVGIYPETKHPTFHAQLLLPINDQLLILLDKAGWNNEQSPVYIQSFEVSNLQYIHQRSTVKLVQLLDAWDVDKKGIMIMKAPYAQPYDFVVSGDPRTYNDLASEEGLTFIRSYAHGIGPWKPFIQPYTYTDADSNERPDDINQDGLVNDADFTKLPATNLIRLAHEKGLLVHAYTFRNEPKRLLSDYKNDPQAEYKNFYQLGIDGVFSDFPATAVSARH